MTLMTTIQTIVTIARLTVLNEAALCGRMILKKRSNVILTRKSSCVNARGIPPARGRKMLTPPLAGPDPPWPAGPDPPPLAGPDPPPAGLTFDLKPPPGWTWHPPSWIDLWPDPPSWTWPPRLDWPLTWPPLDLTPPRCELTNKVKLLPSRRTTYAGGKYE